MKPEQFADLLVEHTKRVLDGPHVKDRFEQLEQRIAALEASHADLAAKALKGGATWQRGTGYAVNDIVQFDGSLWKCIEHHVSGATFSHECFLLQVKRGRDGKDAR